MSLNSGGCISSYQWMRADECSADVQACLTFKTTTQSEVEQAFKDTDTPVPPNLAGSKVFYSVVADKECASCKEPYYCLLKPSTGAFDPDQVPVGGWAVGTDGKQFAATFQVGNLDVGPLNEGNNGKSAAQTNQCKWRPSDWGAYINGIHSTYEALLASAAGNGKTDFSSQLYAVPEDPYKSEYLESEVNLYVYPDETNPTYKKQQEAFLDAIMAVVVDPTTCEDRYSFLNNYPPATNGAWTYSNAEQRCKGFGIDRATEKQQIAEAIQAGMNVWERLQEQRPKQGIVALSAHFLPNNSPKTDTWEAALKGEVDVWSFLGAPWAPPPQP